MKIIGLTGPSGSGKTLLCSAARSLGCETINADEVYHSILIPPSSCLDEIVDFFGETILNDDGTLNRKKLGSIVFSCEKKLSVLNTITHKYVKDKFRELISAMNTNGAKAVIIDAPTLFESGFDKECDVNICLLASRELRRRRIIQRDALSDERADSRLSAQKDDEFFTSRADYTIYNNGSQDDLKNELSLLLTHIMEVSQDR